MNTFNYENALEEIENDHSLNRFDSTLSYFTNNPNEKMNSTFMYDALNTYPQEEAVSLGIIKYYESRPNENIDRGVIEYINFLGYDTNTIETRL